MKCQKLIPLFNVRYCISYPKEPIIKPPQVALHKRFLTPIVAASFRLSNKANISAPMAKPIPIGLRKSLWHLNNPQTSWHTPRKHYQI